ncbi:hypothetical protein [Thioalkalivibrio sp. XN8]|uniref:hypothetical protein n=1 Tax=Thioalkalivibrio sp. XN8 TaxID=2712863 RepID=UPI0013EAD3B8|nr:hypothetical protein [Thioalkalivibrio sp. XN8]NGP53477.1 hypothetical protein [Thioalkalivibrio sp. XN8]
MGTRLVALLLLAACLQPAAAQQAGPLTAIDQRSFSLDLPAAALAQADGALAVDLDGYDLTPFSRVDGTVLRVALDSPLPPGGYLLSLMLFFPDGSVEVLLDTILQVPVGDGMTHSASGMLQASYRVAEGPAENFAGADDTTAKGSVSYQGERRSGAWRLGAGAGVIYDRYSQAAPADERWLLPEYALFAAHEGSVAATELKAGNVAVSQDDLLFSNFQRRGVALQSLAASERFQLQAFSMVSAPSNLVQADELLPRDSDNRSSGLRASVALPDERLRLSGGLVDGRGPLGGAGFNQFIDPAIIGGDSWNVGLDSRLAGGSVALALERAGSNFDVDGIGVGAPERSDDAMRATLGLASGGAFDSGPFSYWSAEFQYRQVGLDYYSMANLALPGNIEVHSAYLQAGWRDFAVDLDLARERSNPDDDPDLATQTLDRAGVNLGWSPGTLDPDRGPWQWLGAPSINSWAYRYESSQPDADAQLVGFDVDNATDEIGLALTFARARLNWGLQLALVDYDDRSDPVFNGNFLVYEPPSDSRNTQASLQASWAASERITLDAYIQRNKLEESALDDVYRNTAYGLSGNLIVVPNRLTARAGLNFGRDHSDFGNPQFLAERLHSRVADLQLSWQAIHARPGRPGLNLNLSGSYARNEDLALLVDDELWSVFVGAQLDWNWSRP